MGWRRDAKELLIATGEEQIMAVAIEVRGESIALGRPTPLFRLPANHGRPSLSPDGERFLIQEFPYQAGQTIRVLTNWHERIK